MGIIPFAISYYLSAFVLANDMLNQFQQINDSGALVSSRRDFKLGFFSKSNSRSRYLGICGGIVAWSTSIWNISSKPTVALLLDSGNLVLRSENGGNTESYICQSFDQPSNTLIAGMKLGWDLRVGLDQYLTSWKSADDPSPKDISCRFDLDGLPQGVICKGSVKQYRTGIWNGLQFNGVEPQNSIFNANFIDNLEEVYFEFDLYQQITRLVLNYTGTMQCVIWNNRNLEWVVINTVPSNPCKRYGQCGPNSICTISNAFTCSCLDGYIPKSSQDWNTMVWNGGCIHKYPLNCSDGEEFVAFRGMIVPNLSKFSLNTSMTLKECELECLKNCSCAAYANSNTTREACGCLLWYGDLIDIKRFANPGDQTLYIRVTAADLESRSDSKEKKKKLLLVIIPVSVALLSFLLASCVMWKRIKQTKDVYSDHVENYPEQTPYMKVEVLSYIRHPNMVLLLGACPEYGCLVYEYMENGSLEDRLFPKNNSPPLPWKTRFRISAEVTTALLFLHRTKPQPLLHRDLKPANILLNRNYVSKISDVGLARTSGSSQTSNELEAEMRRLRDQFNQMMEMYNSVCKEAISSKEKAKEIDEWRPEEERKVMEAKQAQEAAMALAEMEKHKTKVAIEAALMAHLI
ncbi:receptor-like serine/threonine-protein kinase SD1-8 [Camellia sinensis]|uniref:receptor-like serine/threonine-protein kinase SD1-8 n=1 Tax=Camellia sinensis TaxID=4442 RepID=UPI00103653A9|nr:receptor-like serine/threonine-protein kinase SD1-8 [Camellia sinensis]